MAARQGTRKIDVSQAKCTRLTFESAVHFLRDSKQDAQQLTGFDIEAYTGAVVNRWWGKLAVNLAGISAKQQMPIFRNHDPMEIVGYSTSAAVEGCFRVQGVFSGATAAAKEVMALAGEGFPWQASIGVVPKIIVEIAENASMEVNGQQVQGPAEVWLESEVFETSFVPLGADSNTKVTVFSEFEQERVYPVKKTQEHKMDLKELKEKHPDLVVELEKEAVTALTQESLAKANPALLGAIVETGVLQERARIADVRDQSIPGHEALIARLELDGKSTGADAAKAIVAAEKLARKDGLQKFEAGGNPPVPQSGDQDGGSGPKKMLRKDFENLSESGRREALNAGVEFIC